MKLISEVSGTMHVTVSNFSDGHIRINYYLLSSAENTLYQTALCRCWYTSLSYIKAN